MNKVIYARLENDLIENFKTEHECHNFLRLPGSNYVGSKPYHTITTAQQTATIIYPEVN